MVPKSVLVVRIQKNRFGVTEQRRSFPTLCDAQVFIAEEFGKYYLLDVMRIDFVSYKDDELVGFRVCRDSASISFSIEEQS